MPSDNMLTDDSPAQQTPYAPPPTATQFADAFSDLDPLGTGKFRPYIDKKYFFQDLKNPPKKVLKDLTDRDGGFSASFPAGSEFIQFQENSSFDANVSQHQQYHSNDIRRTSDSNDEFNAQFAPDTQIFSPNNNGTHGTPPSLSRPATDVFTATFQPTTAQQSDAIGTIDKPAKTDEQQSANYAQFLVMDSDPFSPRVTKKFDVFEDDFSKKSINSFDFNFGKSGSKAVDSRNNSDEAPNTFGNDRRTNDSIKFNGSKRETSSKRHGSDSMSENEIAPDPPPRSETNMPSDPPPLPPKKQFSDFQVKRPVSTHFLLG